ncbi:MAG: DUF1501 domain-containing protein [Bacteriodetes bacterium]|nr:DUF1501 domain-containing protein [Bacteroidota bacterium]
MKRRDFINTLGTGAILPFMLQGLQVRAFGQQSPLLNMLADVACEDRILVMVQLVGGNDGLNTVIPLDQYANYKAARPNLAIDETTALKLTDATALHPNLTGIHKLYKDGLVNIIQNVGYPGQDLSHFRSTDIWLTASDSDKVISSGWLGRWLDTQYPGFPKGYPNTTMAHPVAIQIGNVISTSLASTTANTGLAFNDPKNFSNINNYGVGSASNTRFQYQLSYIRETGLQIQNFAKPVMDAANKVANKSLLYPAKNKNQLADQLKIVAQLIAGGLKTRVYIVTQTGYDTHASQNTAKPGSPFAHPVLLQQLSEAISAFQDDITLLGVHEKVVGMTFSEFGRRIKENANIGTDHGVAAPLFVFGSNIQSGIVGTNPILPSGGDITFEDNIAMKYDFRSIYASILKDWFCVPNNDIKDILYHEFPILPIIKGSTTSSVHNKQVNSSTTLLVSTPNYTTDSVVITFYSDGLPLKLSLFDSTGREVEVLVQNTLPVGEHSIAYNFSGLSNGKYYLQIQTSRTQNTTPIIIAR